MTDDYRLLTLDDAAKLLHVRWETVRELVETGQLRAVRIGSRYRIPAAALADLGRTVPPPASAAGVSIQGRGGVSNVRRMPRRRGGNGE